MATCLALPLPLEANFSGLARENVGSHLPIGGIIYRSTQMIMITIPRLEFNNAIVSWLDRVLATRQTVFSSHGSGGAASKPLA